MLGTEIKWGSRKKCTPRLMATASNILLNRNAPLEGSSIYTSVYVYIILKISVISSTWWPHRHFAFCQRRHFLQCQMGSRHNPLSSAATSALHIHPRASLILALRPHSHSPPHTHKQKIHTPIYTQMQTHRYVHTQRAEHACKHVRWLRKWKKQNNLVRQAWRGTRFSNLHLKHQTVLNKLWLVWFRAKNTILFQTVNTQRTLLCGCSVSKDNWWLMKSFTECSGYLIHWYIRN